MKDPDLGGYKISNGSALWFFHRNELWEICDEGVNDETIKRLSQKE